MWGGLLESGLYTERGLAVLGGPCHTLMPARTSESLLVCALRIAPKEAQELMHATVESTTPGIEKKQAYGFRVLASRKKKHIG